MIFRSPFPEVLIPETPLTPFVMRHARALCDKPALIDGTTKRTLTYGELDETIRRVAASLHARDLRKGDVFAILSPNVIEYAIVFHAVALIGGIVTPINPLNTADEVASQLKDSQAKFLLAAPACLDKALDAVRQVNVREIFVLGEARNGATAFEALLETDGCVPKVEIDPHEDVVALPYSSGTTGTAKGVMLTHYNLVANLCQIETAEHFKSDDTLICVLPFFHIYGIAVILNCGLYVGATIIVMSRFEPDQMLSAMQEYGVTFAHVVPPILVAFMNHPTIEKYDLSKLKGAFSGAAPLGEELARVCGARLQCLIIQGYGMTETSPATHMTPRDPSKLKYGSVGWCVSNTECKIVDSETGTECGTGACGEIWVRGPQVMRGYLNKPEATAQTIDAEGWLHTGDIGYADEDGYFFIVDRMKELIKYKAFQVAPAELEAILLSHPAIADAAVIPSPDDEAGEVPKAFVVLKDEVSAEEIIAYVAARVAPHKKIRKVEITNRIPKSPSGKILRRILRERERASKQV